MGRRRTSNHDLPPRMHRKGTVFYYVTTNTPRQWIKLGSDKREALRRWAEIEGQEAPADTRNFRAAWERYEREIVPTKAPATQRDNLREGAMLLRAFSDAPLDLIRPEHVRAYLDKRGQTAKVRANREKALLSHIFNHAREWGLTAAPNPCRGVKGFKAPGRDRYVDDAEFQAVWQHADQVLRDAMDLALLTGQRPADVLKAQRGHIKDGALWVKQGKTGKRLRITIEGDLLALIQRCTQRPGNSGTSLLLTDDGDPLSYAMLRRRFDIARRAAGVDFQFRDIRAKTATDADDLAHAQRLLGHKGREMTEHYTRQRAGEKVSPLRRIVEKLLQNDSPSKPEAS